MKALIMNEKHCKPAMLFYFLHVYDDPVHPGEGKWTAGWGHLLSAEDKKKFHLNDDVSTTQAELWFKSDLKDKIKVVNDKINNSNLKRNQFEAIVDLAFNTGLSNNRFIRQVNSGNFINFEFRMWNKEKNNGLDSGRANEARLFFDGNYNYDHNLHTNYWKYDRWRYEFPNLNKSSILEFKTRG